MRTTWALAVAGERGGKRHKSPRTVGRWTCRFAYLTAPNHAYGRST